MKRGSNYCAGRGHVVLYRQTRVQFENLIERKGEKDGKGYKEMRSAAASVINNLKRVAPVQNKQPFTESLALIQKALR